MESAGPSPGGIGAGQGRGRRPTAVGFRRRGVLPPVTCGLACSRLLFFLQLLLGDAFRNSSPRARQGHPKAADAPHRRHRGTQPLMLLVNIAVLFFAGRPGASVGLERARQVLVHDQRCWVFLLTATYVVAFVALRNVLVLYSQFGGFTVSAAGLLLGLKQAAPEEEVRPNPQSQGLRYKYLPLVFLASSLVLTGVLEEGSPFFMALYGTLASWFYIRRFQRRRTRARWRRARA